jgi:hypothetical protein
VSAAYVVFLVTPNATDGVHFGQIVWDQQRAEELVRGLNALGPKETRRYAWREIWVEDKPEGSSPPLTASDREKLLMARAHDAIGTERPISVGFTFLFNRLGARATADELRRLGWPKADIDEELTGDDLWHAYAAHRRMVIDAETISQLRAEMEALAHRYGGSYDGWDVTGGFGLRSEIGKLAT